MKLLVTDPKTIRRGGKSTYYAMGTVAEFDDTQGGSYHRLFGWPYADEDGEVSAAPVLDSLDEVLAGPVLADLTKKQLIVFAADREIELPAKATKTEIREILEAR